jgi:ABC-type branched-subunit amino acid transport system ATPase component
MPTSSVDRPQRHPALLRIDGLTAGYSKVPVIHHVSAQVGVGEVVTVVGPNGAGKSTLLKAVAGILDPQAGTVSLDGQDVTGMPPHRLARHGIGYVPQSDDVFPNLTVVENLEMGGYLLKAAEIPRRITAVTERLPTVGRLMRRRAATLSGGERKMVAIARALMTAPRLLILDEPTAGLSPELSQRFLTEHVPVLAEGGAGILLVEQRAYAALEVSDWSYLLVAGAVEFDLPARELLARGDVGELFLGAKVGPAGTG